MGSSGADMRLPRLYAIVDATVAARHGWRPPDLARAYLAAGARLVQVRAQNASGATFLAWCEAVVEAARAHRARVIVNDRADIARLADAAGVHLGQDDLPVRAARALVGAEAIVGLSTHSAAQVDAAVIEPVTYIAVGPVFDTTTKATGRARVGVELVREAVQRAGGRPIVAIGGITLDRAPAVLEAGAAAVAVISDLLSSGDPEGRVRAYVERLEG